MMRNLLYNPSPHLDDVMDAFHATFQIKKGAVVASIGGAGLSLSLGYASTGYEFR
jgi:hypothetical protein